MLEAFIRILHIFAGAWVVGYYLLMVPIVLPQVMKLAPPARQQLTQAFGRILTPIMWSSLLVLIGTGIAWTLMLQGNISQLFSSGWGWAIIMGLVLTIALIVFASSFLDPVIRRAEKLGHSIQGRAPTPAEGQQMDRLMQKVKTALGVNFAFAMIIFTDMLIARYI